MAVHLSRGCAAGPSKADTLLLSYQTTPRTQRTLPARPAPPLTRIARLLRPQAGGRWLVVHGRAARPEDIFFLCEAGAEAVAGIGGAAGRVFSCR